MKIESGRKYLWQWELNRRLEVPEDCTQVHFANGTTDKALVLDVFEENGKRLVKVPDELLWVAAQLRCYAWDGASVIETESFDVLHREKPDDYVYEPEEVRRYEKLEAELRQCIKEQAALQSQGRSANYDFHSGGWKRILNFIRSSSGHLNLCVVTPGIYRLTHILSLDITGFVKYAQDTSNEGKPVIIKRYENIFGEDDAMQKHPVKITKIRVGYPKAGTDFPKADGTIDYGANPVNCYVDVYVEFDGTDLSGPYAAFNMNFAGFAENHNCEAVTDETDAPSTGYYGEELEYYEVAVKDIPFYLTKDNIGGGYGLKVNTNGYVGMEVATEKQIDAAKAKYLAITPTNVQYAIDLYTKEIKKKAEVAAVVDDANVGADAWSSKNIVDKLCPAFAESGSVVVCEPVEGYPLTVISYIGQDGASKITLRQDNGDESRDYTVDLPYDISDASYNWTSGMLITADDERIKLTPQVITALHGVNTFQSDCGDTTVSGRVDPNNYWGKKLAEQEAELAKLNKQYELIEEVTLEEDAASFTRTADPYGVPYDFSAVRVQIKAEIADKSQSLLSALGCATLSSYVYHQISNGLSTEVRHAHLMCRNDHGQLDYYAISTNTNSPGNMMARANYLGKAWQNITRINLAAATSVIPAGTTIKIYGIRG